MKFDEETTKRTCEDCMMFSQLRYTGRDAWGDCALPIPPSIEGRKVMVRKTQSAMHCPGFVAIDAEAQC